MNFRSRWNNRGFPLPLQTRARTLALPAVAAEVAVAAGVEVAAEEVEVVGAARQ